MEEEAGACLKPGVLQENLLLWSKCHFSRYCSKTWRLLPLFRKCSAWVHTYFMPCKLLYYLCWLRSGWVVLRCRTRLIFLCIVFPGGFLFVQRNSCSGRFSMLKVFINLAFSHIRGCRWRQNTLRLYNKYPLILGGFLSWKVIRDDRKHVFAPFVFIHLDSFAFCLNNW